MLILYKSPKEQQLMAKIVKMLLAKKKEQLLAVGNAQAI
jgi:CO dehydrogenase/acetyl-CoA synthase epsilon subunit